MSYEYDGDRHADEVGAAGGGFMAGILSGVAIGIGLGMLLAPRSGAELRQRLATSAGDIQRKASESYSQASTKVREAMDKGREAMSRGQEKWNETLDEAGVDLGTMGPGATPGTTGTAVV